MAFRRREGAPGPSSLRLREHHRARGVIGIGGVDRKRWAAGDSKSPGYSYEIPPGLKGGRRARGEVGPVAGIVKSSLASRVGRAKPRVPRRSRARRETLTCGGRLGFEQ
jgi:hypothetical protein